MPTTLQPAPPAPTALLPKVGMARALVKALRPYQWAKNGLIFLPVALAHRLTEPALLLDAMLAFAALSLCASGTYVVNDLLDREQDRLHPIKRRRPFASGALSPRAGVVLVPLLIGGAFLVATALPLVFTAALVLYLVTTLAYSLLLKRVAALDVVVLGGLYALRVMAGAAATGVPVSEWLLAFSLFFFLCLALLKRYAELRLLETELDARRNGRGYTVEDVAMLRGLGPACGFLAVLVLALYTTSPEVASLYTTPILLWLVTPLLLYWVMHLWLTAHRRAMPDDPVLFALKDPVSWAVFVFAAAVVAAAAMF
ncbi:MAG TPA: UbiA family prenyltransferase [Rubricoccaceae bacterium]|nr:UbiA family prenyltransferase [Rubricoccaceae bacterium]